MKRLGFGLILVGLGLAVPAIAQVNPDATAPKAAARPVVQARPDPSVPFPKTAQPAASAAPAIATTKKRPVAKADTAPPADPAKKVAASKTAGRECTRLPLSDIQFGRDNTIKVAREKLEDYAKKEAAKRGWKSGYTRSAETATCEDYLWLPIGGQEYKCLVTATFCRK